MIKFRLYSKKSPKDMTDSEAKKANYKDTSDPSFIRPAAKIGAAAGAIGGLKKSLGKRGLIGTAVSTGWGAAKGAATGAGIGLAANIGSSAVGYTGKKIAKTTKEAKDAVNKEVKKFSKINDIPEKRAGLVATGTAAGAGLGGLLGAKNVNPTTFKRGSRAISENLKRGNISKAGKNLVTLAKSASKLPGFKKGAMVGGVAALSGGLKLTSDKRKEDNIRYNKELKDRKKQIGK